MTLDKLKERVRERLDEVALNDANFLQSTDNVVLDQMIAGAVEEGLRFVISNANPGLVQANEVVRSGVQVVDGNGICFVQVGLTDKFIRLVWAKMNDWLYPVSELIHHSDTKYAMLKNPFTTGTWQRPRVGLVDKADVGGGVWMELYGPKDIVNVNDDDDDNDDGDDAGDGDMPDVRTDLEVAVVNVPVVGSDDVGVCDKLEDALVYHVAGVVLLSYNDGQHANDMFEMARALMGAVASKE